MSSQISGYALAHLAFAVSFGFCRNSADIFLVMKSLKELTIRG
jgi:hypothetical protein